MDFSLFIYLTNFVILIIGSEGKCPIQIMYQLGDSTADTGNVQRISRAGPPPIVTQPPYGMTFPGRPFGRLSDGRLILDYIAIALGLPLLNPYLDKNASFTNGVNFAVAGATALNSSFLVTRGLHPIPYAGSLDLQLISFRKHLASICSTLRGCVDHLREALIFVGEIGVNDITIALLQGKSLDAIRAYVPLINQAITNATREIIRAGASRVVVPGSFPIGCFPSGVSVFSGNNSDEFGCVKSLLNLTSYQNENLQVALDALRRECPDVTIIYADYYNAFLSILGRAAPLGFDGTTLLKPCCRSKEFDPLSQGFCGNPRVAVCRNPQQYIHWDGLHLTQEAHRRISDIVVPDILSKINCSS